LEKEKMEENMNEIPAAPVEQDISDVTPEIPEHNQKENNNSFSSLSNIKPADLDVLNDEERDLYNDVKDLSKMEITMFPPDVRADIRALQDKLTGNTAEDTPAPEAEPAADDDPEAKPEAETKDQEAPADKTTEAVPPADSDNRDEIIRRLTEENRKLTARYDTLQGKYNAEVKAVRSPAAHPSESAPEAEPEKSDPAPTAPPSAIDREKLLADLAEKHNLDESVMAALGDVFNALNNFNNPAPGDELTRRVNELYQHQENLAFDQAIKQRCGGLGLHEVGTHPLFRSFADEMFDEKGISAWDAIAEAKSRRDHSSAAAIVSQVVNAMQKDGMWNINGRYSVAEPAAVPPASAEASPSGTQPAAANSDKPSAVVPHNVSGVTANVSHTATIEQLMERYAELEKRLVRKGDMSVVPAMDKLDAEITRRQLAAAKPK
jgi:hypothetical protein